MLSWRSLLCSLTAINIWFDVWYLFGNWELFTKTTDSCPSKKVNVHNIPQTSFERISLPLHIRVKGQTYPVHANEPFILIAPLALNLGARWSWVANLSLMQRKRLERIPVPFNGRLGGPRSVLDVVENRNNFLPLPELDPRTIGLATSSLKRLRYLVSAAMSSWDSGLKYRTGERAYLLFIVVSFSYCSFLPHLRCCCYKQQLTEFSVFKRCILFVLYDKYIW
jgi:hypothetical protein